MYDFTQYLQEGEFILYQGQPSYLKKEKKSILLSLFLICFLSILGYIMINQLSFDWSIVMNLKSMIAIVFLYILWIVSILAFVYHCFLGKRLLQVIFIVLPIKEHLSMIQRRIDSFLAI